MSHSNTVIKRRLKILVLGILIFLGLSIGSNMQRCFARTDLSEGVSVQLLTWNGIDETKQIYSDVSIETRLNRRNTLQSKVFSFSVLRNGVVTNKEFLPAYILAETVEEQAPRAINFEADYLVDGEFIVDVCEISAPGAELVIELDGKIVFQQEFVYHGEQSTREFFTFQYVVDIPAGKHDIRIYNNGSADIIVSRYIFSNYLQQGKYTDIIHANLHTVTPVAFEVTGADVLESMIWML